MIRKETISRFLALTFILSGLIDLGLASVSNPNFKSEGKKKEIRVLLNNHCIPFEGCFNRSKSESEFKEESLHDADELFFVHPTNFSAGAGRFIFYNKITPVRPWPLSSPIFILNRQLLV